MDYCNAVLFGVSEMQIHQLQLIQNPAAKRITGKYKYYHLDEDLNNLHWLSIKKQQITKDC